MAAHVLVVEDDEATRGALRALLDDAGYLCDEASDGERAVAAMRDARFDLVLLDLGLPGMSGADVHRQLRRDPRTRFMPIVFLTAHSDRQVKLAELEAGAEDFITKPYDADELLARAEEAEAVAEGITRRFDERIRSLYDPADRARGWIEAHDRRGRLRNIPIATVSIGIVNVPPGRFKGATAAARAAAEVKEVAKRRPGSAWAVDRRKS